MKRVRIPYPWPSILAALCLMSWFVLLTKPSWSQAVQLPEFMARSEYLLTAILLWLLLTTFDIQRFFRGWSKYKKEIVKHEEQIADLFESRRELGTRARTYSSHAEKLKLFISDKLLEYIEYDEKFLHFKNIASEVRHNGVISYDRARTALKHAAEICNDRLEDPARGREFKEASESLRYLWDLLDIATTDNIALHVANRIYDCEEYYFQSQLDKTDPGLFPYRPTFSMLSALQKTLMPIVEDPEDFILIALQEFPVNYLDRRFQLLVTGDTDMLGNRNHMVLLLENLLNNALFYAEQNSSKTRFNRVTILQTLQPEQVVLEVYNRGPRIKDEDRDRIFQLGYSSRRIRDHHGKGLGLYFVNEICKGFEGLIEFENIENRNSSLSLRAELDNGEVVTHFVNLVEENGKALCRLSKSEESLKRSIDWSFSSPIASIEVSSQSSTETQVIDDLVDKESVSQADASDPLLPRWSIDVHNRKRSSRLVFKPIDVRGVRFRVRFPTALSRLENEDAF
jgi:signal transduction histidine kinase